MTHAAGMAHLGSDGNISTSGILAIGGGGTGQSANGTAGQVLAGDSTNPAYWVDNASLGPPAATLIAQFDLSAVSPGTEIIVDFPVTTPQSIVITATNVLPVSPGSVYQLYLNFGINTGGTYSWPNNTFIGEGDDIVNNNGTITPGVITVNISGGTQLKVAGYNQAATYKTDSTIQISGVGSVRPAVFITGYANSGANSFEYTELGGSYDNTPGYNALRLNLPQGFGSGFVNVYGWAFT